MSICPLEFRYGRQQMKSIFSEEEKLRRMLQVEAALAKAHAVVGNIPFKNAVNIGENANTSRVRLERVRELDKETGHDVMAIVLALSEICDQEARRYVHLGATSNDITDTATAMQLAAACDLVEEGLRNVIKVLADLARKHRDTVMLGRTHGQAAVPITFGLKMAVYAVETMRHLERIQETRKRVAVGKMSGAVGTGAALGSKALKIQEIVMKELHLGFEEASGQIVGRDRYAELVAVLANVCSSAEKFATEVRNLQRNEIGEVAEAFRREKQVGSSTMAHKENPVTSENICGLARVVRGLLVPAFEDIAYWHERDITQSSTERFLMPHAFVLTDDILAKTADVFSKLRVYPERMRENIERMQGQVMAESVMIALVGKGMGRQEAHKLTRDASMAAREKGVHLKEVLLSDKKVMSLLNAKELAKALDPASYIGSSGKIVDSIVKKAR